jgi:hypothetical protein
VSVVRGSEVEVFINKYKNDII